MQLPRWTLAIVASLVVAGGAWADDPASKRPWAEPARRWQKVSDLIGKDVALTQNNEKIGDVDNVIVDLDSSRILYYIVESDGKYTALPMAALTLPGDAIRLQFAGTKDQLKANSFEKDNLPNFADRTWSERTHSEYKIRPYWENPFSARVVSDTPTGAKRTSVEIWYSPVRRWYKGSDILGKNVENPQNENLGKIEDLVVDPDTGRIIYSVLSFGGFLGMGDKLFAVPFQSLLLASDSSKYTLNVDKERLKNAQGFDKKNWPNMADSRWARETHDFYKLRPYWEEDQR